MTSENKQLNSPDFSKDKNSSLTISEISFLKDKPHIIYLYKKTEKLVSALYLLSNFISDKEPIKWQMREAGINLLSQSLSLTDKSSSDTGLAYKKFICTGLEFISLLEVSYASGIISEMNFNVLKSEFEGLIRTAGSWERNGVNNDLAFSEHFFEVPDNQGNGLSNTTAGSHFFDKGHAYMSDRLSVKKTGEAVRTSEQKQKDKTNRQDIIISLLKKNTELSIKDFTTSIKDCSEKTIQRELVSLVSKGLIKKEGEKRWSKYSLK